MQVNCIWTIEVFESKRVLIRRVACYEIRCLGWWQPMCRFKLRGQDWDTVASQTRHTWDALIHLITHEDLCFKTDKERQKIVWRFLLLLTTINALREYGFCWPAYLYRLRTDIVRYHEHGAPSGHQNLISLCLMASGPLFQIWDIAIMRQMDGQPGNIMAPASKKTQCVYPKTVLLEPIGLELIGSEEAGTTLEKDEQIIGLFVDDKKLKQMYDFLLAPWKGKQMVMFQMICAADVDDPLQYSWWHPNPSGNSPALFDLSLTENCGSSKLPYFCGRKKENVGVSSWNEVPPPEFGPVLKICGAEPA